MDEHEPDRAPAAADDGVPARDPDPDPDPDAARRRRGAVAGGVLLGLFLGFLVIPFLMFLLVASRDGSSDLGVGLAFAVPGVLGLLLLVSARTRRSGAGMLLGLAIGLVVGSASCVGYFGYAVSTYNT